MLAWVSIFVGGGLGSLSRYAVGQWTSDHHSVIGTLVANVIACLILGFLLGLEMKRGMDQNMRLLFMVGFCGGFSTFSTFSADALKLIQEGSWILAVLYILMSVMICILTIALGLFLSKYF